MGCPAITILGQNLTFSIQANDGTGAPVTPTGNVNYAIYEDLNTEPILSGTMTKDFASKTGLCRQQIACTSGNGFEQYKSYMVLVTAVVSGITLTWPMDFICLPAFIADVEFIKNVLEGDTEIDNSGAPWQRVVKIKGTATELVRKDWKDINGDNVGSISTIVASDKEPT